MRAGVMLLSWLALATNASAQLAIIDAPVPPQTLASDAFVVSADPSYCLVPSTLSVATISPKGSSTGIGSVQDGVCRWIVRGLAAGTYEIGLTHSRGSGGRVRFDYVPGQLTELRIPAPAVTVTGVVRINGEPESGATIMFIGRPLQNGRVTVVTKADGAFEAFLPEAGEVGLRLSGSTVYGQGVSARISGR